MPEIHYTTLTYELCQPVADLLKRTFPDMLPIDQYDIDELEEFVDIFAAGQIVALHDKTVVGVGLGIFLDIDPDNLPLLENELLYDDDKSRHDPAGDFYYGCDLAVHSDYRGQGIARQIYVRRKAVVTDNNKRGFYAAAVLPGFAQYKEQLKADEYVEKVVAGELFDPTLSVQLRNGFRAVKVLHKFYTYPKSDDWCALILWDNPALTSVRETD